MKIRLPSIAGEAEKKFHLDRRLAPKAQDFPGRSVPE